MVKHVCEFDTDAAFYGPAIDRCEEREDGTFWVDNGEYASRVNFCPNCGEKAPTGAKAGSQVTEWPVDANGAPV